MNLIKLTTTNWRNFYGKHELNFSNERNKHVTLIHGQNGTGKTTMLNAIKWCLYRTTPDFDHEVIKVKNVEIAHYDTWNSKIENGKVIRTTPNDVDSEFEVELRFEHDGVGYRAIRKAHQKDIRGKAVATGKDLFTLFKIQKDGTQKIIEEPDSAISRILPGELSDYFLFSGETVGKVLDASANEGRGYKNAVRDILGFTLSDIAIKDLDVLAKKNTNKINRLLQADTLTQAFGEQLTKLNSEKELITGQLNKLKDELKEAVETDAGITKKISDSGHDEAQKLGSLLREKESAKKTEVTRRQGFLNEKIDLIENYGFAIFGTFLTKEIKPLQKEKYEGKLPAGYVDSFINKLLKDKECICTRDLKKDTHEYNAVKKLLDSANTELIDDRVR